MNKEANQLSSFGISEKKHYESPALLLLGNVADMTMDSSPAPPPTW
jgi:hypothetical protein